MCIACSVFHGDLFIREAFKGYFFGINAKKCHDGGNEGHDVLHEEFIQPLKHVSICRKVI